MHFQRRRHIEMLGQRLLRNGGGEHVADHLAARHVGGHAHPLQRGAGGLGLLDAARLGQCSLEQGVEGGVGGEMAAVEGRHLVGAGALDLGALHRLGRGRRADGRVLRHAEAGEEGQVGR